jgi:hypothetical protein
MLGYEETGLQASGERMQDGKSLAPREVPRGTNVYVPQTLPFNPNWEVGSFLCRLPWGKRPWWHVFWPQSPSRSKQVAIVLAQLGLADRMHATVAELSGGEAQRAAWAQLLLIRPRLFVSDELTGVDPGIAHWMLDQCRSVMSEVQGAAVLALHDVHIALRAGNRLLIIWPAWTGQTPWIIGRASASWNADVLHALLCLSRWCRELEGETSIARLLVWLRSYLELGEVHGASAAVGLFGDQPEPEWLAMEVPDWLAEAQRSTAEAKIVPLRCQRSTDGKLAIGMTLPIRLHSSDERHHGWVSVLAETKGSGKLLGYSR